VVFLAVLQVALLFYIGYRIEKLATLSQLTRLLGELLDELRSRH
jgi:hypothetical protein